MVINESKRDDLLLPYLEQLKERGINATLGQLKTFMLRKLTEEGGLRNLSLSSNFYLAGATRYYFNGDLTLNKDLSVFKDDPTEKDTWNTEVCDKLNALIKILRNAYIDTVGQSFEQPEDFGTLSLPKLLRKYNKKITVELNGKQTESTEEAKVNYSFGNDYTFDIIYSYEDARKYNKATCPDAWCITYGEHHYNNYIKRLNIHYVILRKNGWENVPRQKGPEWTSRKPQDEYGCSLIALLQSNTNGEPVYITSRWNHGSYSDDSRCEADYAFTKEELFAKTGMTDADLQYIFNIWYKNDKTRKRDNSEVKKEQLEVLRHLKYTQMRINGGDLNVNDNFKVIYRLSGKGDDMPLKINKELLWCETSVGGSANYTFLMDNGKIIFETLNNKNVEVGYKGFKTYMSRGMDGYNNLLLLQYPTHILLYDTRRHSFIDIDGIKKFKAIPISSSSALYYEVCLSKVESALLSYSNNMPLKLPNGSSWFNAMKSNSFAGFGRTNCKSNFEPRVVGLKEGGLIEFLYDASSNERFLYDINHKKFIQIPQINGMKLTILEDFNVDGFLAFNQSISSEYDFQRWSPYRNRIVLFKGNEQFSINGANLFKKLKSYGNGIIGYCPYSEYNNGLPAWQLPESLYDLYNNKDLKNPLTGEPFENVKSIEDTGRLMFISTEEGSIHNKGHFIYDKKQRSFIKNPIEKPTDYTFWVQQWGDSNGEGVIISKELYPVNRWSNSKDEYLPYYFALNIPGSNNAERLRDSYYWDGIEILPETHSINRSDIENMVNEVIKRIMRLL